MGSTLAFKITASLIKPTREALLDYCSYILIILSIISIARVLIGKDDLRPDCYDIMNNFTDQHDSSKDASALHGSTETEITTVEDVGLIDDGIRNISWNETIFQPPKNWSNTVASHDIYQDLPEHDENFIDKVCPKYYQAYFPYFLLLESCIFLLIGIFWVKMPKVSSLVNEFSGLLHQCQSASWLESVAGHTHLTANTSLSQSLYSAVHNDTADMEVQILVEALFHERTAYPDKSQARSLFEKVQTFCEENRNSKVLWRCYIRKSLYQLLLWLLFSCSNMVLFVKMEFYVGCNTTEVICDHDTFLRIIWFMVQLTVIVYGMFNCSTLKWINDKSISVNSNGSWWNSLAHGCCIYCLPTSKRPDTVVCQPFHVSQSQEPVRNDVALLLHLVTATKRKMVPYFTVFLFDQWNDKLQQSDETVELVESADASLTARKPRETTWSSSPPKYVSPSVRFTDQNLPGEYSASDKLPLYENL